MKRSRLSEEQIIGILKEHQAGITPAELCRKHGLSDATFYTWRKKYGGIVPDVARQKAGREVRLTAPAITAGQFQVSPPEAIIRVARKEVMQY